MRGVCWKDLRGKHNDLRLQGRQCSLASHDCVQAYADGRLGEQFQQAAIIGICAVRSRPSPPSAVCGVPSMALSPGWKGCCAECTLLDHLLVVSSAGKVFGLYGHTGVGLVFADNFEVILKTKTHMLIGVEFNAQVGTHDEQDATNEEREASDIDSKYIGEHAFDIQNSRGQWLPVGAGNTFKLREALESVFQSRTTNRKHEPGTKGTKRRREAGRLANTVHSVGPLVNVRKRICVVCRIPLCLAILCFFFCLIVFSPVQVSSDAEVCLGLFCLTDRESKSERIQTQSTCVASVHRMQCVHVSTASFSNASTSVE